MGWAAGIGSTWQGVCLKDDSISMRTREVWRICISEWLIDCTAGIGTAGFDSANRDDGGKMVRVGLQWTGWWGWGGCAWDDSLIAPRIHHPTSLRCESDADDQSCRAWTCLQCVADERHEAAVHHIRGADTRDEARMVNEWIKPYWPNGVKWQQIHYYSAADIWTSFDFLTYSMS